MTNPNTLTAEKIAEIISKMDRYHGGGQIDAVFELFDDNWPEVRQCLSSAEQVAALQQRVGELEAKLLQARTEGAKIFVGACDSNSTLEAALAEATRVIYRFHQKDCICVYCNRHAATPAKEKP